MIGILDYGLGNIKAFINIFNQLHKPSKSIKIPSDMKEVSHLILPGVGSFDLAMQYLHDNSFIDPLNEYALLNKKPILGICLGMQIMAEKSEEGVEFGLNWIPGTVKKIRNISNQQHFKLPHMGWNKVSFNCDSKLFKNITDDTEYYFLHKYCYQLHSKDNLLAKSNYGENISAAIRSDNIFGVQFHPEKSHKQGIEMLKNFSEI